MRKRYLASAARVLTASHKISIPQKYYKDVTICRRVRHENILNIEGVVPELFEFCMVSKWMDNGNMLEYVRTKERVDRAGLVSSPAF